MAVWGAHVTSELDKVKGKKEGTRERNRARALENLLAKNDTVEQKKAKKKRYADPNELFK